MKTKLFRTIGVFLVCLSSAVLVAAPVFADDIYCSNEHLSPEVKEKLGCENEAEALPEAIKNIIYFVIGVGGLVAVAYVVVGAVGYITSQGDTSKVQKAKTTILYAVIGLIVCSLAFVIVNFVIEGMNS